MGSATNDRTAPSPPPRVLVSGGLAAGGVRTHVRILCRELRAAGAEVTIAAANCVWPSGDLEELRDRGVRVLTTPFGFGRWAKLGKVQAVATWPLRLGRDFDTMYCHGRGGFHVWMRRFLRPGGASLYHEIVDSLEIDGQVSRVLAATDAVVANSAPVRDAMVLRHAGLVARVIPFLTSAAPFPKPAPRPPIGDRVLRVAFLGRLVGHKQPDWLVENWGRLSSMDGVGPARLDLFGDDDGGGLRATLARSIRESGQSDAIALRGTYPPDRVAAILADIDLVLLPSLWEGLPLVLVEAMLCGVPFVAMTSGGIAELANDDVEVSPCDRGEFAAAFARIATRLRVGGIDHDRLFRWADARYGHATVSALWRHALLDPRGFFGLDAARAARGIRRIGRDEPL